MIDNVCNSFVVRFMNKGEGVIWNQTMLSFVIISSDLCGHCRPYSICFPEHGYDVEGRTLRQDQDQQ